MTPEDLLQTAVASALDAIPGLLWLHVPNEGVRTAKQGAHAKRKGLKPGAPDVLIFPSPSAGYRGIAIELKSKTGRVSPEQSWWLSRLVAAGWRAEVCRSVAGVLEVLVEEGVIAC